MSDLKNNTKNVGEISILIDRGRDQRDWYVFRDQRHFGPFSYEKVTELIEIKAVDLSHHIWRPGFENWLKIESIDELSSYAGESEGEEKLSDTEFELNLQEKIVESVRMEDGETKVQVAEMPPLELEKIQKYKKTNRYLLGLLALFVTVGFTAYMFSSNQNISFDNLNSYQKEKLTNISNTSHNPRDIRFEGFLSVLKGGDPVFVFASNLKEATKVRYTFSGVKDTLVGQHRLSIMDTVGADKMFESNPLRSENGKFIPAGIYFMNVTCSSCIDKTLLKKEIKYFPKGEASYLAELKEYKLKTAEAKNLEIEELAGIIPTLEDQIKRTRASFSSFKGQSSWNKFSKEWLLVQNDLVGLFAQLEKSSMQDKIYHLQAYLNMKELVKQTFELHVNQSDKFKKTKNTAQIAKKIEDINSILELNMTAIKNEIKSARLDMKREAVELKTI